MRPSDGRASSSSWSSSSSYTSSCFVARAPRQNRQKLEDNQLKKKKERKRGFRGAPTRHASPTYRVTRHKAPSRHFAFKFLWSKIVDQRMTWIKDTLNTCLGQCTGRIRILHERPLNGTCLNILKGQAIVCPIAEQIMKVHAKVVTIIIVKFCRCLLGVACTSGHHD